MDKKQSLPNGYMDAAAYGTFIHTIIADYINGRSEADVKKTTVAGRAKKSRIPSESPLIEDVQFKEA